MQQPPKKLSNIRDRDHPPTLEQAKAEMDAASKTAQAKACAKSKTPTRSVPPKTESTQPAATAKPTEPVKQPLRGQKASSMWRHRRPYPPLPWPNRKRIWSHSQKLRTTSTGEKTKIW